MTADTKSVEWDREAAIEQLKAARRRNIAAKAAEAAKKPVLTTEVSAKVAAAVKARPEKVAIVAEAEDGTTIFERPARLPPGCVRVRVDMVDRVDAEGRPIYHNGIEKDYHPYARFMKE